MSQFEYESDDQSAAANALVREFHPARSAYQSHLNACGDCRRNGSTHTACKLGHKLWLAAAEEDREPALQHLQALAANTLKGMRTDSVEMLGGVTHLPAEFREVARLANAAGLAGYEFVDAEVGMDLETFRQSVATFNPRRVIDALKSRVLLTYRKTAAADSDFLTWLRRAAPETLKTWELTYAHEKARETSQALRDELPETEAAPLPKVET